MDATATKKYISKYIFLDSSTWICSTAYYYYNCYFEVELKSTISGKRKNQCARTIDRRAED